MLTATGTRRSPGGEHAPVARPGPRPERQAAGGRSRAGRRRPGRPGPAGRRPVAASRAAASSAQVGRRRRSRRAGHVEVAGHLAEREVLRAMQRQREHRRVVAEDRRRCRCPGARRGRSPHAQPGGAAVAAVPFGLHQPRGHRHVVEDAVARPCRPGRGACRRRGWRPRPPRRTTRAAAMSRPPSAARSTMRSTTGSRSRAAAAAGGALEHRADPGRLVRQRQFAVAGGGARRSRMPGSRLDRLAQQPVFRHRKLCPAAAAARSGRKAWKGGHSPRRILQEAVPMLMRCSKSSESRPSLYFRPCCSATKMQQASSSTPQWRSPCPS